MTYTLMFNYDIFNTVILRHLFLTNYCRVKPHSLFIINIQNLQFRKRSIKVNNQSILINFESARPSPYSYA